jgi:hypothetical protein
MWCQVQCSKIKNELLFPFIYYIYYREIDVFVMDILIPLINGTQSNVTGPAKLIPNPQLPISIKVPLANPEFTNFN